MSAPGTLRQVGLSVVRKDGLAKVTGAAEYLDDLTIPNAVVAALVRSPYAHARIVRVDTARAAAAPACLPHIPHRRPRRPRHAPLRLLRQGPARARRGVVRFEGEPVVAVVAAGARAARAAAALVDVE